MTVSSGHESFQWFKSLDEVPGVVWVSPQDLAIDSRLAEARPVRDEKSFSPWCHVGRRHWETYR